MRKALSERSAAAILTIAANFSVFMNNSLAMSFMKDEDGKLLS